MNRTIFPSYIMALLLMSILLFSCDDDILAVPYTQPQDATTTIQSYPHAPAHITPSRDDAIDPSEEFILLVPNDTNVEQFVQEIGAALLQTLEIRKKLYILVTQLTQQKKHLQKHPSILALEPNVTRSIHATQDPLYNVQYAPQLTNLEELWNTYTGQGVKVAVIDTGVNTLHEDFVNADGSKDAFIAGYDVNTGKAYAIDTNVDYGGHGTSVAGVIAARKDNNKGIAGVAPQATIIPIKGTRDSSLSFTAFDIATSVKKATELGADIINLSFGGALISSVEENALHDALARGITVIASSGNSAVQMKAYPASIPGIIVVGSSNGKDEVSEFSTSSPLLSVVAPGEDVLTLHSATTNNVYDIISGTSFSAPFVAGVAALIKEKFPAATPAQIKKIIESTAKDIGPAGYDIKTGWGRIQPDKALETATLPNTAWANVEFTITLDATPVDNYYITILNEQKTRTLYSTQTNSAGKAFLFLEPNKYNFISNRLGIPFEGALEFTTSAKVTKTKNFVSSDYENHYRFLIYRESASWLSDTFLTAFLITNTTCVDNPLQQCYYSRTLGNNDDIASENWFSHLYFTVDASNQNDFFMFVVEPYDTQPIENQKIENRGPYRVLLERGAPVTIPANDSTASSIDVTNDYDDIDRDGFTIDVLKNFPKLEAGKAQYGRLAYKNRNPYDVDYFIFDPNNILSP